MSNEAQLGLRLFLIDSASPGLSSFGTVLTGMLLTSKGLSGAFGDVGKALSATKLEIKAAEDELLNLIASGLGGSSMASGLVVDLEALNTKMNLLKASTLLTTTAVAGLVVSAAGVLGFGGAIFYATEQGAKLQDSLVKIQNNADMTGVSIGDLQTVIVNLANNSTFSTANVADAFANMGQKSFTAADIIRNNMGGAAIWLAQAIGSDLVPAADLMTQAMQNFNIPASHAVDVANTLTNAFHNGVPDATMLADELTAVGAQAHTVGWSLQETTQMLDLLAQAGIKGSSAGTSLRYMLASLVDPTNKVQAALASVGLETVHTNAAFDQFRQKLSDSGKAGAAASQLWDGSVHSLALMFAAAQKIPGLTLDKSFYQWGVQSGILSSKLFDAHGNLLHADQLLQEIGAHMGQLKTNQQFLAWIGELGGARSGKSFQALFGNFNMTKDHLATLKAHYKDGNVALTDSNRTTDTFSGALKELQTTFTDLGATTGQNFLTPLKNVMQQMNQFFGMLSTNPAMTKQISEWLLMGLQVSLAGVAFFAILGILGAVAGAVATLGAPVVLIVAGIVALVAAVGILLPRMGGLSGVFNGIKNAIGPVLTFLAPIGKMIQDEFGKALSEISKVVQSQLMPAFHQLVTALQPAFPLFKMIGMAIGIAVAGIVGLAGLILAAGIIGIIMGIINGVKMFVIGLTFVITGMVTMWTGVIKAIHAIFTVFHGIFTGNTDMIKKGGQQLVAAIGQIFTGLGKVIVGLIVATFGTVIGYVGGFIAGFIGFFQHLWSVLVGHSIIPDMVMAIIMWIGKMVIMVLSAIGAWEMMMIGKFISLVQGIIKWLGSLPGAAMGLITQFTNTIKAQIMALVVQAPGWMSQMMHGLVAGIMGGIGWVQNAISNVVSSIMGPLAHHSPAKEGALKDDDTWMPNMMRMHARGIEDNVPLLQSAMGKASRSLGINTPGINSINTPVSNAMAAASAAKMAQASSSQGGNITIPLYLDSKCVATATYSQVTKQLQLNGYSRLAR